MATSMGENFQQNFNPMMNSFQSYQPEQAIPTIKPQSKKRVGKREQLKRLKEENTQWLDLIGKLQQQLAAVEAQNSMMVKELKFFHQQIQDALPLHPELEEKAKKLLEKSPDQQPPS